MFTASDTTGEKDFEEFFTENEVLDMNRFENLGVIKNDLNFDEEKLNFFTHTTGQLMIAATNRCEDFVNYHSPATTSKPGTNPIKNSSV